jgi:hypothetical protein
MSLFDAQLALRENARLFASGKYPAAKNTNTALQGICEALERLRDDVALLHNKLQPILKELSDDQDDWQSAVRGR